MLKAEHSCHLLCDHIVLRSSLLAFFPTEIGQATGQTSRQTDEGQSSQMCSNGLRRQASLTQLEIQRTPLAGQRHGVVDGYATLPQTDRHSVNVNLFSSSHQTLQNGNANGSQYLLANSVDQSFIGYNKPNGQQCRRRKRFVSHKRCLQQMVWPKAKSHQSNNIFANGFGGQ